MSSIKHSLRLLKSGTKEVLFKKAHEQVGIGRGHTGSHGGVLSFCHSCHIFFFLLSAMSSLSYLYVIILLLLMNK